MKMRNAMTGQRLPIKYERFIGAAWLAASRTRRAKAYFHLAAGYKKMSNSDLPLN